MRVQKPNAKKSIVTVLRKSLRSGLVRLVMVCAFKMNLRSTNGHSNAIAQALRCNCLLHWTRSRRARGTARVLPKPAVVLTFFAYEEAHRRALERPRFELRSACGKHRLGPN